MASKIALVGEGAIGMVKEAVSNVLYEICNWDVLQAIDWLRGRSQNSVQIDKGRIGCVGCGIGGLLALPAGVAPRSLVLVEPVDGERQPATSESLGKT